jgi:hypothetical protein
MTETKIYVKDEQQKEYLKGKFPDVDAQYLQIPAKLKNKLNGPIVCQNDQKIEDCPTGEEAIEKLREE